MENGEIFQYFTRGVHQKYGAVKYEKEREKDDYVWGKSSQPFKTRGVKYPPRSSHERYQDLISKGESTRDRMLFRGTESMGGYTKNTYDKYPVSTIGPQWMIQGRH